MMKNNKIPLLRYFYTHMSTVNTAHLSKTPFYADLMTTCRPVKSSIKCQLYPEIKSYFIHQCISALMEYQCNSLQEKQILARQKLSMATRDYDRCTNTHLFLHIWILFLNVYKTIAYKFYQRKLSLMRFITYDDGDRSQK